MNKRVVTSTGLHDADIRPKSLLAEFQRLSIASAEEYFGDASCLVECGCPGCGADDSEFAYRKQGFDFRCCGNCQSVYVSPRPSAEAISEYYRDSAAAEFRSRNFTRETEPARRALAQDRAQWIERIVDEYGAPLPSVFCDIDARSLLALEELSRLDTFEKLGVLSPAHHLSNEIAGSDIFTAREDEGGVSAVSAFEQLEHQSDTLAYVERAAKLLAPGGLFFFTTRTCDGFDLLVLGEHAPYIIVPEHLNLLSVPGLEALIRRAGLELIELSTPGQLDVELVLHAIEENPDIPLTPFAERLIRYRNPIAHADFQAFLQQHRLSSHVRIAARKPQDAAR